MPYSMDPEANRDNPTSPSAYSMTEQLLYKIAALDASVQSGFRRIDEKMDRFQSDLHNSQIATNDRINNLEKTTNEAFLRKRQRLDNMEKDLVDSEHKAEDRFRNRCQEVDSRLHEIETWQKVAMARVGAVAAGISVIWVVFAPYVRHILGLE